MQTKRAAKLREKWMARGNPPCDHPHLDKEYYLGAQTGDYVCTTCGKSFSPEELEQEHKKKE